MGCQIGIGGIEIGLVAAGLAHPRRQIVRHQEFRHAAEEIEGPHMGPDPVRQGLAGHRLGIGVARRPQHRDEDLGRPDFTGAGVDQRHGLAGEVDEQLLAGPVDLPHHPIAAAPPRLVVPAEPGVLEALGAGGLVLLPQQEQRDAFPPQFLVHRRPLRDRSPGHRYRGRWREQGGLQVAVGQTGRHWPDQARRLEPTDILAHAAAGDPDALGNLPIRPSGVEFESQNLSNLAHGYSLHSDLSLRKRGGLSVEEPSVAPAQGGGGMAVESVAESPWNGWPNVHGISGRMSVEFAVPDARAVLESV